jgi:hypothetical protein
MRCYCCVFFLKDKLYLSKCSECKKNNLFVQDEQTERTNTIKSNYQFKWYEYGIKKIRDDPHFRLGIELICIIGCVFWLFIAYLEYFKLANFKNTICGNIISFLLIIYTIILVGYFCVIEQLYKNKNYQL